MEFQRARSDEQRDQRRAVILATATAMLAEMPVADMSLNELARRVGLAKSNVLRYFESREAVLLDLLTGEIDAWVAVVDFRAVSPDQPVAHRAEGVAAELASTLSARATLCDLISTQAAVLERNVSTDVVIRHKRAIGRAVGELTGKIGACLPDLPTAGMGQLIAMLFLLSAGAWPHGQPTEAMLAAYEADPAIGAHSTDFRAFMQDSLEVAVLGLFARGAAKG